MNNFGFYILIIGLTLSIYSVLTFLYGEKSKDKKVINSAIRSFYLTGLMIFISSITLIINFLRNDFSNIYVFNHSSTDMNPFLTFVAFYAGNEGSLLFILLVHIIASIAMFKFVSKKNKTKLNYPLATINAMSSFYFCVLIFFANPFEAINVFPIEGKGINPLLRHPGMYIHPPLLMSGLSLITIPFVLSHGSIYDKTNNPEWKKYLRTWALISWAVLGAGLLIGAWWAYTILGWGGYWGWDPIENVGLMPWLVLTAFIHSIIVEERRGMFRLWNIILISIAYILALLGIFINRGGPVVSVHSFAASTLGFLFLSYLIVMSVFALMTIMINYRRLKNDQNKINSYLSREVSFLLNNILLVATSLVVLWGVIFPVISILFTGTEISVSAPYFNKTAGPLLLCVVLLMGIGPVLSWNKTSYKVILKRISIPLIFSMISIVILLLYNIKNFFPLISIGSIIFVFLIVVTEWFNGTKLRMKNNSNPFKAFITMIVSNRGRNGGYIVHIAILSLALGIIGTKFYDQRMDVSINTSESINFSDYRIHFKEIQNRSINNNEITKAIFEIYRKEKDKQKYLGDLVAMHSYYPNHNQISVRSGIISSPIEDLYVIPKDFINKKNMTIRIAINPLAWWIWVSGPIFILGTVVALWPENSKEKN
ncbi:MAG: cytochrome c-type biogenesis CcmF C-terminal domain-containing protein [Chloroflexota bacterium]|nr:cytochrome c-type biogenesis CcmF C-terminal domain-containing protein [Chloroflexota bacterium]